MGDYQFVPGRPAVDGIVREPLGRQIATAIARDIISGRLVRDEAVSQEGLCSRFGTSRMPVRDALQELASAGYLIRGRGNQLRVAPMELADIEDVLSLEATLTGLLARRTAERGSDAEMARLAELHDRMCEAADLHDGVSMSALNHQFHNLIAEASRSARLIAAVRATTIHVGWQYYVEQPDRMKIGCIEHEGIVTSLIARDALLAQRLMSEHVESSQRYRVLGGGNLSSSAEQIRGGTDVKDLAGLAASGELR